MSDGRLRSWYSRAWASAASSNCPGGDAQDRLPGIGALRLLRDGEPVLQGDVGALRPFRHPRQALAPGDVLRPLAHGGARNGPGVVLLAVFQENLVGQAVDLVIEGQARCVGLHCRFAFGCAHHAPGAKRRAGHAARGQQPVRTVVEHGRWARCLRAQCGGLHERTGCHLRWGRCVLGGPQQGHAQELAHVAVGHVRSRSGAGQLGHAQQHLGVIDEHADLPLAQGHRVGQPVAGLQCVQGGEEVGLGVPRIGGGAPRQDVELGAGFVVGNAQGLARGLFVQAGGFVGVGLPCGQFTRALLREGRVVELCAPLAQARQPVGGPVVAAQCLQLLLHDRAQAGALLAIRSEGDVPGVVELPVQPCQLALNLRVGTAAHALQLLARLGQFPQQQVLARQQQVQLHVGRVAAQQVLQIHHRQRDVGVGRGRGQAALQILPRIEQPERTADQAGQQHDQPGWRQDWPLSGLGIEPGCLLQHGRAGRRARQGRRHGMKKGG